MLGHTRLITNGFLDNQPIVRGNIAVFHNGIVVNDKDIWKKQDLERKLHIDSEIIAAIAENHVQKKGTIAQLDKVILDQCVGVIACALVLKDLGKLLLFSNNGSLYIGEKKNRKRD